MRSCSVMIVCKEETISPEARKELREMEIL
jgi:hypothetical protein